MRSGVLLLGALILIDSYARAVSGIAKFQSWQVIVRYGSQVLHGEHEDFKASTGFAFALDVISGVGGMLVGIAVLPFVGRWVGIQPDQILLAMLYCTLLPTMAVGHFDRSPACARPLRPHQLGRHGNANQPGDHHPDRLSPGGPFIAYLVGLVHHARSRAMSTTCSSLCASFGGADSSRASAPP